MTFAPQSSSRGANASGIGAVEAVAVFIDGDLNNQGQFRCDVFRRQHGLMQFLEVAESFENQQVDAALGQGSDLLAECLAGLFEGSFAQRLDSGSERANRSCDPDIEALGGLAGQPRPGAIDVATLSAMLCRARRKEFAPKVLVSMISAPA